MDRYDQSTLWARLSNLERLVAKLGHEYDSQFKVTEELRRQVASLEKRSEEDAAKIGALSESIEKARKAFTELKKNG